MRRILVEFGSIGRPHWNPGVGRKANAHGRFAIQELELTQEFVITLPRKSFGVVLLAAALSQSSHRDWRAAARCLPVSIAPALSVSDLGVRLSTQLADQTFDAFITTKPHGIGLGLRTSRAIIESHDSRLWVGNSSPRSTNFYLTPPIKAEVHE